MTTIEASCLIEEFGANSTIKKTIKLKKASLNLVKSGLNKTILKIQPINNKSLTKSLGYTLSEFELFKKFLNEGKVTINFVKKNIKLYISDCAPDKLRFFVYNLKHRSKIDPKIKSLQSEQHPQSLSMMEECSLVVPRVRESNLNYTFSNVLSTNHPDKIEQNSIFELFSKGRNIFCTGGAGSGKSYILKKIIKTLSPRETAVTASTGVAATIIGGTTLHNFFGYSKLIEDETFSDENQWKEHALKTLTNYSSKNSFKDVKYLIIDEISMVSARTFDRLDFVARVKKGVPKEAFGGIQLCLFGDFFQLPPVYGKNSNQQIKFAFESNSWRKCQFNCIELTKNWRQAEDKQFSEILDKIRVGECPDWIKKELNDNLTRTLKMEKSEGIIPIRLCTHRADADSWNNLQLERIKEEEHSFLSNDSDPTAKVTLDSLTTLASHLRLKVGAWVMLTKNLNQNDGLVNGTRGKVVKFLPKSQGGYPDVEFQIYAKGSAQPIKKCFTITPDSTTCVNSFGRVLSRSQLPLQLAWSISIHKSQGITLDSAEISLAKVFEYGQAYVALSRCRNLNALYLIDWNASQIRAHPNVKEFYDKIRSKKFRN